MQITGISSNDWKKIAAGLKAGHDTALDLYTILAVSLGRGHPAARKALAAYRQMVSLKSDMQRVAKENAGSMFTEKEINRLFWDGYQGKPEEGGDNSGL